MLQTSIIRDLRKRREEKERLRQRVLEFTLEPGRLVVFFIRKFLSTQIAASNWSKTPVAGHPVSEAFVELDIQYGKENSLIGARRRKYSLADPWVWTSCGTGMGNDDIFWRHHILEDCYRGCMIIAIGPRRGFKQTRRPL